MSLEISQKILFVDDEQNVLDGIKRQFGRKFDIDTALGGKEAIELLESCPYAVVISDLRMEKMDGLEFLMQVKKISTDSICIMLTGFGELDIAVQALNEGRIFKFLTKPCPPDILTDVLNMALEEYRRIMAMTSYTYTTFIENSTPVKTEHSQGCLAVTGYSGQEFVGNHSLWLLIIVPEYRSKVKQTIEDAIAGQEVRPIEFKIRRKDGNIRWMRNTLIPHFDDEGNVYRIDGMIVDITECKEMENALKQSEARYERMVANAPGLVFQFVLRTDGNVEFVFLSDSCKDMFGLESDEVIQDSSILLDKIHPEDRAEFYRLMAESAEKLTPWDWWGYGDFKNQERLFQGVARPDRLENGDTLWDGLMLDMTEYRRFENEVRQLARFPAENPNPVLRVSGQGYIMFANDASDPLLSLWGRKVGQMLPDNMYELVQSVKKNTTHECIEVKCKDHIFSIVFAPIPEDDYVNLYARDITEAKFAEIELRKANEVLKEHDRLKSEFVSTVSHELRTPLCIFKNIVANAMAGVMGKVSHKLYESLKMADTSIDRLSRIVSDFLDISKIESGLMELNREPMDINPVVTDVVHSLKSLAEVKDIDLTAELSKEYIVYIDKDKIIQILTNLVGNAIKFIPVNSHIKIQVLPHDEDVEVVVKDDGPGLSKEEINKIFDRFVQIHKIAGAGEHGTGLGLTIAKELVEMHNGKIWVESEPGMGCCFHFTLPKYDPNTSVDVDNFQLTAKS